MELEVIEDESGKYHYPVWWVMEIGPGFCMTEMAGPFETEMDAVEAMYELDKANGGP